MLAGKLIRDLIRCTGSYGKCIAYMPYTQSVSAGGTGVQMADLSLRWPDLRARPKRRLPNGCARAAALSAVMLLSSCASLSNGFIVSPAGPIALLERHELKIVALVLLFVFAPVALLTPLIAWHYRLGNARAAYRPQWGFSWILEVLIWVPPTGIVVLLSVFLVHYTFQLDPYRPLPTAGAPLEIDVVALDWKWLFIYPAQHIATVNQLFVPVGQPVQFSLTSGTVMQSLLMPRIAGQIYAMAGMKTRLNFEVSRPGVYLGENTQYNGDGFTKDKFSVNALPAAAFAAWVTQVQANPGVLDAHAYQQLSWKSLLAKPQEYGHLQPDLFSQILGQKIVPGYVLQNREDGNG